MRNRKTLWIVLLTFLFILPALALPPKLKKISVPFIKNEGQTDKKVSFYAKTFGGTLFVTKEGKLIYSFPKYEEKDKVKLLALEEVLLDAKVKEVKGTKKSITKVNYFIGNDPKKWKRNVSTYEGVTLGEVYEGITLKLRAYGNNVEKIFRVKAGADPDKIKLSIKGAKELKIDKETGELVVITELGEVRFTKPVAYQVINGKRKDIEVGYKLLGKDSYAFAVGKYDRSRELVIDPLLASTYIGTGADGERGRAVAVNRNTGDIYIAGDATANGLPAPGGAYTSKTGSTDWYIARLSLDLSQIISATYLGGSCRQSAFDIAIDSQNRVVVGGLTCSNDFPMAVNNYADNMDGVLAILSQDLSQVIGSRYFDSGTNADNSWDEIRAIAIDSNDNILIGGGAFPLTKVSPDLQNVKTAPNIPVWTGDVLFDNATNTIYVVGATQTDGLADSTAFDQTRSGWEGIIVSYTYNSTGDLVQQNATYLGGSGDDAVSGIAINSQGDIVVVGTTASNDLPTPQNPNRYSDTHAGGTWDMFVAVCSPDFTALKRLTYIGGTSDDRAGFPGEFFWDVVGGIILDSNDNVYISGRTNSTNYPTTTGAYQRVNRGDWDVVISLFSKDLTQLLASTYVGGSGTDFVYGIDMDPNGNIVVTGWTSSNNFPTTQNAFDNTHNGLSDFFVSILTPDLSTAPPVINSFSVSQSPVTPGTQVTFTWNINEPEGQQMKCDIDIDNDGNIEQTINPCTSNNTYQHTYNQAGSYTAKLIVTDINGGTTNATVNVLVNTPPAINSFSANPNSGNAPLQVTFSWNINDADGDALTCQVDVNDDGTPETTINNCTNNSNYQHTYNQGGNYTARLIISDGKTGGTVSQIVNVSVNSVPQINSFSANPTSGNAPLKVTFSWDINDGDGDTLTCKIDVDNDGNVDYTIQACTNNSTQDHTYKDANTYTVKLIVEDSKGGKVEKTLQVVVKALSSGGQGDGKKGNCSTVAPQTALIWMFVVLVPLVRRFRNSK